jgi:acetyl esterase/lipase
VYVNYHGGGWVFGGFITDKPFCSKVCNRVVCVVVDVDYRLAPEHPWPAQLQDSWAAFLWVSHFGNVSKNRSVIMLSYFGLILRILRLAEFLQGVI